jgi:ferredoxin
MVNKKIPMIVATDCIACGNCAQVCPEVFRVNDSLGHSEVVNPHGAPEEEILDAIEECPVQCIHWAED